MGVYLLICEDASNLGGPMGSEYTTHVFSKVFSSLQSAKDYAKAHRERRGGKWPDWAEWKRDRKTHWHVDAGTHIYKIDYQEVEE